MACQQKCLEMNIHGFYHIEHVNHLVYHILFNKIGKRKSLHHHKGKLKRYNLTVHMTEHALVFHKGLSCHKNFDFTVLTTFSFMKEPDTLICNVSKRDVDLMIIHFNLDFHLVLFIIDIQLLLKFHLFRMINRLFGVH